MDREDLEDAIQGRRVRQARHDGPVKRTSLKAGAASLLTNPDVMIFFVMVTLMGFAKGVVDSFLFIFIDELGMPSIWSPASQSILKPAHVGCMHCALLTAACHSVGKHPCVLLFNRLKDMLAR